MNILFLCTTNVNRSKSAEDYFGNLNSENTYKSAGLSEKYCKKHNTRLCTIEMLEWADIIYVMEKEHEKRIAKYAGKQYLGKVFNLNIVDRYTYMSPELIETLVKKIKAPDGILKPSRLKRNTKN